MEQDMVKKEITSKINARNTSTLLQVLGFVLVFGIGIAIGYYLPNGKNIVEQPEKECKICLEDTPEITEEVEISPIISMDASPSVTPKLIKYITRTIQVPGYDSEDNSYGVEITLEVPEDVKFEKDLVQPGNAYILRKGTKAYMMFHLPYELYEQQGYSSVVTVQSDTISALRRIRARQPFEITGKYKFAVAYVKSAGLLSGKTCTNPEGIGSITTSPCAFPVLSFEGNNGWISVYCSVDSTYQELCDRTMKTVRFSEYQN